MTSNYHEQYFYVGSEERFMDWRRRFSLKKMHSKWHLVPARAGLNRCRKSCRLRWLNYLRPHIKRDGHLLLVDFLGRTTNDVKNYWNTHLQRKSNTIALPHPQKINNKCRSITYKNEIIRPQPRKYFSSTKNNIVDNEEEECKEIIRTDTSDKQTIEASTDNDIQWWTNILENCYEIDETPSNLLHEEIINGEGNSMQQGQTDDWDDFSLDIDLWDLLN